MPAFRVATPDGYLPATTCLHHENGRADHRAPIVLHHYSLGCVTLWRGGVSKRLAIATVRDVITLELLAGLGLVVVWQCSRKTMPKSSSTITFELPADHPHVLEHTREGTHRHAYRIDILHRRWPG